MGLKTKVVIICDICDKEIDTNTLNKPSDKYALCVDCWWNVNLRLDGDIDEAKRQHKIGLRKWLVEHRLKIQESINRTRKEKIKLIENDDITYYGNILSERSLHTHQCPDCREYWPCDSKGCKQKKNEITNAYCWSHTLA